MSNKGGDMSKKLNPAEETVTFHVKIPRSLHVEFFLACEAIDKAGGAVARRLIKDWLAGQVADKTRLIATKR